MWLHCLVIVGLRQLPDFTVLPFCHPHNGDCDRPSPGTGKALRTLATAPTDCRFRVAMTTLSRFLVPTVSIWWACRPGLALDPTFCWARAGPRSSHGRSRPITFSAEILPLSKRPFQGAPPRLHFTVVFLCSLQISVLTSFINLYSLACVFIICLPLAGCMLHGDTLSLAHNCSVPSAAGTQQALRKRYPSTEPGHWPLMTLLKLEDWQGRVRSKVGLRLQS